VILADIVKTDETVPSGWLWNKTESPVYEATVLTTEQLRARIQDEFKSKKDESHKKVLLGVHSYDTNPTKWLELCSNYKGNYLCIPILWPCKQGQWSSRLLD